jgi:excisionase family DNA binding protein
MARQAVVEAPRRRNGWLTLGQACRVLGVDESTLRRWADTGYVRVFRTPGGHRRFAEPELQELLAGRASIRADRELGDLAITRIRRDLHRRSAQESSWYATVGEESKERLRPLGRRLATLAAEYLRKKNRRSSLLEDARGLGREYGQELASSGLPLSQAVEAFIFFRRSLDDATKDASRRHGLTVNDAIGACQQVTSLADHVLVGITEAYQERT